MAEKLIRLPQLQRFKQNADAKYQDKLTAGSNITISGNTISAQTTFGQQTIYNATITAAGWSGTSNTVTVQGIAAGDDVEIVGINPTGMSSSDILAAKTALGLITYGTTAANSITFYALGEVPTVNIPVTIRKIVNLSSSVIDYSSEVVANSEAISTNPSYLDIKLIKQGRICVLSGFVRFVAASAADTPLFTVPTGALPSSIYTTATILGEITGDRTARNCQIVSSTGVFRMHNDATPSSGYMRFNGTYISET